MSKLVLLLLLLILLVLTAVADTTDTIRTFDISGTATCTGYDQSCGCSQLFDPFCTPVTFSGAFQVDVTAGEILPDSVDITVPGFPEFSILADSFAATGEYDEPENAWIIDVGNLNYHNAGEYEDHGGDAVELTFYTNQSRASLVGFDGAKIRPYPEDSALWKQESQSGIYYQEVFYEITSGSITPIATSTPEPSFIWPLGGTVAFGLAWRRFARLKGVSQGFTARQ
jgi:hypothetical protein